MYQRRSLNLALWLVELCALCAHGQASAQNKWAGTVKVRVAPQSFDGGMIAMELVLFDGARPVMTTDLKLMNHGILIVGGPRYQQGMLLTIIATDTNDAPAEAPHDASPPPPPLAPPSLGPAIPATAPNAPNLPH